MSLAVLGWNQSGLRTGQSKGFADMATYRAPGAIRMKRAIGTALAAGAMVWVAPAGIAIADWHGRFATDGASSIIDVQVENYTDAVNAAIEQFTASGQPNQLTRQQLIDQLITANRQLQDALQAANP